ncbi:hypothetical protein LF95_10095 [Thalassospira sp. TSL5-1]|nr:hypothetical protein LF95_10095 [Thalassospira sp. TSL5-1]
MPGGLILGSARCGSTLISEILRLHPEILSISELFSTVGPNAFRSSNMSGRRFWRYMAQPSAALSQVGNPGVAPQEFLYGKVENPAHDPWLCPPILAITLPHLCDNPDGLFDQLSMTVPGWQRQSMASHYRALFSTLADHCGTRRMWVERSGGSLVAAGTLLHMFPEARPVLLLRNGADTALSMRDYPATRLAIWMWRHLRPLGIDLLDPHHHYGKGGMWPLVARLGSVFKMQRIIQKRPSLKDCGAFWSAITRAGLRALNGHDPMVLSYDLLCDQPHREIARLGDFLLGDAPENWLDQAARLPQKRPSRLQSLTLQEQSIIRDACAPGEHAIQVFLTAQQSSGHAINRVLSQ